MASNLEIKKIVQKQIWENFLIKQKNKTFLNSWNWAEFQDAVKNKIWRFGIYDKNQRETNEEQLITLILVIKIRAKRANFLLTPHCPILSDEAVNQKSKILNIITLKLKQIAKQEKCSFIRIAPIWKRNIENIKIFKDLGFRNAPIHTHPEASWKLDISLSEDKLLRKMRKTTRYLIRQAQKNKDIEIIQSQKLKDLDIFNNLYKEVSQHKHFTAFSLEYLKNEFSAFSSDNQVSLFFGKYKKEIVAAGFVIFWSGIGFYHHAALSSKYRKIPVAYLLQWEAIKQAKKRGCILYDFWGYVNNPKHPWYGPTLFKMGFSGFKEEYVKTQDLILSPKYWLNYVIETIRRRKRRL